MESPPASFRLSDSISLPLSFHATFNQSCTTYLLCPPIPFFFMNTILITSLTWLFPFPFISVANYIFLQSFLPLFLYFLNEQHVVYYCLFKEGLHLCLSYLFNVVIKHHYQRQLIAGSVYLGLWFERRIRVHHHHHGETWQQIGMVVEAAKSSNLKPQNWSSSTNYGPSPQTYEPMGGIIIKTITFYSLPL